MGTVHARSFRFYTARSVLEAVEALSTADNPMVLAGGQTLVPLLRARRRQPDLVVDIGLIPELAQVRKSPAGPASGAGVLVLTVGATARQSEVLLGATRTGQGLLAAALTSIGTPLTRRRGTIGGIVAHGDPALQLAAVSSVLDPIVTVTGPSGVRTVPASAFFTGRPLGLVDLVTEVSFPAAPAHDGWGFARLAHRRTGPQLAGAAARVALDATGRCTSVRVAAYTFGHRGGQLTAAGEHLLGFHPDGGAIEQAACAAAATVRTTSDMLATASYRRHAVQTLIRRALLQAVHQAQQIPAPVAV